MGMGRHLFYALLVLSRMALWAVAEPEALLPPHAVGHEHPPDEEHHHGDEDDRHESPDSPCHHHDEHCVCTPLCDTSSIAPAVTFIAPPEKGVSSSRPDSSPRLRIASCDIFHPPRA